MNAPTSINFQNKLEGLEKASPRKRQIIPKLFSDDPRRSKRHFMFVALIFFTMFAVIFGRLVYLGLYPEEFAKAKRVEIIRLAIERPDIIDRNGLILATDIRTYSVGSIVKYLPEKDRAAHLISSVLPDIDPIKLLMDFESGKQFVQIKRNITKEQRDAVFALGLPGVEFTLEHHRYYPNGRLAAHILGATNVDNEGLSGFEKYIDSTGLVEAQELGLQVGHKDFEPFQLSIDIRVQHALRDELANGVRKYSAIAAAGMVYDVVTGEIIALASLPDFDPNNSGDALKPENINRILVGTYELGSTFKALNTAMALDSGKISINDTFDTSAGMIRYGKQVIHEYHGTGRKLTVPEVFVHSSNIGSAKMALIVGTKGQQEFLKKMGILDRVKTELPESASPQLPPRWSDLSTMTISFGHGIAVTPLSAVKAVGALVNGGHLVNPTFLKRLETKAVIEVPTVIKPETSEAVRYVMRLNAEEGTAKSAAVEGYFVGGKTGTADKNENGKYMKDKSLTTFMAITPADNPRYLYLVILDEPKGIPETHNLATASWNSGAVTGKLIERTAPMLMPPNFKEPQLPFPTMVKWNAWGIKKTK